MKYVVLLVDSDGYLDSVHAPRPLELSAAIAFALGYGAAGPLTPVVVMADSEQDWPRRP